MDMAEAALLQALPSHLKERSHGSSSTTYESSQDTYYAALASELQPSLIVQPTSAQDVSDLLKALRPLVASHNLSIAVRGGGHTPWAGCSNVQGGVTIDLSQLKGVELRGDKTAVKVAGGEKWETVYGYLEEHGLTAAGGRIGDVGVGGLTLGGGLSYYSTKRGFVCDNVQIFEVVLASGEIIHASSDSHSDLWWALRGGSNNFGIVISFEITVFSAPPIWGGLLFYDASLFPEQLKHLHDFTISDTPDELSQVLCSVGYGYGYEACTNMVYHVEGDKDAKVLKPFTTVEKQIENMGTLRSSTHKDFADEISRINPRRQRTMYMTTSIKANLELMLTVHQKWRSTLDLLRNVPGMVFSMVLSPMPATFFTHSEALGGNCLGISANDAPFFVVCIKTIWGEAKDDERVMTVNKALVAAIDEETEKRGLRMEYKFLNYAYKGQDVMAGYGKENLEKLQAVSRKYDPDGFFQKAVPGGFKLF